MLLVLFERDDRSVGEIGRPLFLDSGTLTPVLRRLERLGLVTRRRAAEDERAVRIELTAAGRALAGPLADVRTGVACRAALAPADVAALRETLRELGARLRQPALVVAAGGRAK